MPERITLAQFKEDAEEGLVSNPSSIEAILLAFADLRADELFHPWVRSEMHPAEELTRIIAPGEPDRDAIPYWKLARLLGNELEGAVEHSHIEEEDIYLGCMRQLSNLAQMSHCFLPPIRRTGKGE